MELITLNINGNNINFLDQPDGLDKIQIGYDRIPTYNGFKTEAKVTLTFYCGSGYNALKAEYERAFVDGIGYIEIAETCNDVETKFKFNLDFSKYKQTTDTIQVGLNESSEIGDLLDSLDVEKELDESLAETIKVRNLDITYKYHSDKYTLKETPYKDDSDPFAVDFDFVDTAIAVRQYLINPKTETTINELDDGVALSAETVTDVSGYNGNFGNGAQKYEFLANGNQQSVTNTYYPEIEPQAIFTNEVENGFVDINTNGSTALQLLSNTGIVFRGKITRFSEWFIVGKKYESPSYIRRFILSDTINKEEGPLRNTFNNISLVNNLTPFAQNSFTAPIKKGESVWHFYAFDIEPLYPAPISQVVGNSINSAVLSLPISEQQNDFRTYTLILAGGGTEDYYWDPSTNAYVQYTTQTISQKRNYALTFQYNDIGVEINRTLDIEFTTNQNVTTDLIDNTNIDLYSTPIKAFKTEIIANNIFDNLSYNELSSTKYNDLYLSKGDLLRDKKNRDKIKITPSKFFENLEKMTAIGLGVYYNNSLVPTLELRTIEDFYTNNIFLTYNFEYDDVTITIAENLIYKGIEIGYDQSKDAIEELHGKNTYQIDGAIKAKNTYQKVCEWIASKFLIKKALTLGTSDESKEFDNNYFVFSIDTANNATISDNSASATIGKDLVFENNISNVRGLNRKYASIFNLRRHFYKWGFGLRKGKTNLSTTKSANNQKEVKYVDGFGYINYPSFIPASNDITTTELDVNDNFIPHYIEFSVVMNITEFSNLRKNWYDMIQLNVDSDVYYGNIVSADFSEGVCKFKLIGREQ